MHVKRKSLETYTYFGVTKFSFPPAHVGQVDIMDHVWTIWKCYKWLCAVYTLYHGRMLLDVMELTVQGEVPCQFEAVSTMGIFGPSRARKSTLIE